MLVNDLAKYHLKKESSVIFVPRNHSIPKEASDDLMVVTSRN